MKLTKIKAVIVASLFLCGLSHAEDPCEPCEKVLQKDITSHVTTYQQQVAFLRTINKERFEALKKARSAGVSIPLPGFSIDFSSSYEEFEVKRKRYFETNNLRMDIAFAESILRETIPNAAYDKWQACIERCFAARHGGVHVWVELATREFVDIGLVYNSPSHRLTDARNVEVEVSGGELKRAAPRKLEHMEYHVLRVKRSAPGREVTFRVSSSDFTPKSLVSEWSKSLGMIHLTYETGSERKTRVVKSSKKTPKRHEQNPVKGDPTSPGGKFRAAITSLEVRPKSGRYLKNAKLNKSGSGKGHSRTEQIGISQGGSMAFATVRNWSHSFKATLSADEYETIFHSAPPMPIFITEGKPIFIEIPNDVRNPLLRVQIRDNNYLVIPGQSYGDILKIAEQQTPTATLYTYEVRLPN